MDSCVFKLPPKGMFLRGGSDDPLPYYYRPLIGRLFIGRVNTCLSLLRPPYGSILDVGYGSGILIPTLVSISNRFVGIDRDTNQELLSRVLSKAGLKAELIEGSVERLDLRAESFDLIVLISVLEEVASLSQVVDSIYRVLKPGGELLVGIPRMDFLMTFLFRFIGHKGIENEHVHSYKDFLNYAQTKHKLNLVQLKTFPRRVFDFAALYYAMLLKKPFQ